MSTQDHPLDPSMSNEETRPGMLPPEAEQRVKDDLQSVTETAKRDFEGIKAEAEGQVDELKQQAQEQMGVIADKARSFAGEQKDFAATQLGGVATALSRVADELETDEQAMVAGYARDLAGGLSRMSESVRDHDVDDLIGMVQDFGRRQPVAFLGAAALAGFVASRFVLASAQRRGARAEPGYASDYGGYRTGMSDAHAAGQRRTDTDRPTWKSSYSADDELDTDSSIASSSDADFRTPDGSKEGNL